MTDHDKFSGIHKFFRTLDINQQYANIDFIGGSHQVSTGDAIVEATIYKSQFMQLTDIVNQHFQEIEIRNTHEAVNNAYQQYLTLVNLVNQKN
jgi:hypothetical protein